MGVGVVYGGPAAEAPAVRSKEAYVVGGGNSAGQAALHLARYARHVTVVVRALSVEAGMSHYLIRGIETTPNVDVLLGTEVLGGGGEGRLQQRVLQDRETGETSMRGVLAARDVRRSSVKRVASAVGEGSIAIQLVQALLASERHPGGAPRPRSR